MIKLICISTNTIGGAVVKWWQRVLGMPYSQYSHVAFVMDTALCPMAVDMTSSGNGLKPIMQYEGCEIAELEFPDVDKSILLHFMFHHVPYSYLDLAKVSVLMLLRKLNLTKNEIFSDDFDDLVCSNLPKRILAASGKVHSQIPHLISPAELAKTLGVRRQYVLTDNSEVFT
jgi:hypothetical protein